MEFRETGVGKISRSTYNHLIMKYMWTRVCMRLEY